MECDRKYRTSDDKKKEYNTNLSFLGIDEEAKIKLFDALKGEL